MFQFELSELVFKRPLCWHLFLLLVASLFSRFLVLAWRIHDFYQLLSYTVIPFCTLPLRETWIHATHISNWQCQPMAEWHYTTRCMMACALSQCMSSSPLHILARFRELCICDWNRYVSLQPRTPGPHSCWEIKSSSCANWITLDPTDQNKDAKTCILHHLEDSKRVSDQPCLRSHKMLPIFVWYFLIYVCVCKPLLYSLAFFATLDR